MNERVAFVLGGGGSRGALQVGALQALLERKIYPDMVVGSSVGAINGTFLAKNGISDKSLTALKAAWDDASKSDLLPANYLWLTVRVLFNRVSTYPTHRLRDFFIEHGVKPDLRFADLPGPRLFQVATDLNKYCSLLYGTDPRQSVLEGLLASTALPPWMLPMEVKDHFLMDGGVISNLPIEPAISQGATRIYAFDLSDPSEIQVEMQGFGAFYSKLIATIQERQIFLELALAEARQIPVHYLRLKSVPPVPIWDFSFTRELIVQGYHDTNEFLDTVRSSEPDSWERWVISMRNRLGWNRKVPDQKEKGKELSGDGFHSERNS